MACEICQVDFDSDSENEDVDEEDSTSASASASSAAAGGDTRNPTVQALMNLSKVRHRIIFNWLNIPFMCTLSLNIFR